MKGLFILNIQTILVYLCYTVIMLSLYVAGVQNRKYINIWRAIHCEIPFVRKSNIFTRVFPYKMDMFPAARVHGKPIQTYCY